MKKLVLVMVVAACGAPVLDEPTQAQEQSIARFVADVSPELSLQAQAAAANCGAQNTTTEDLRLLSELDALDAASTGLISEIMTRDGTLACMMANGVSL
ncbi:hypothetical protein BDE40_0069 [Litoreibacter halocynthiae]|uniref:Uncharacterized protein n=1 Tax=Litoreibacter halocynthiae TaxID=1242689 RepID=A0A4R7LLF2_9RHOB|nr:hypothetical protein [Litoreibacter halocynthiae]TDT76797.1 hypothetical protein BDE40_0069 [Litoreibacter halocynthiae]